MPFISPRRWTIDSSKGQPTRAARHGYAADPWAHKAFISEGGAPMWTCRGSGHSDRNESLPGAVDDSTTGHQNLQNQKTLSKMLSRVPPPPPHYLWPILHRSGSSHSTTLEEETVPVQERYWGNLGCWDFIFFFVFCVIYRDPFFVPQTHYLPLYTHIYIYVYTCITILKRPAPERN